MSLLFLFSIALLSTASAATLSGAVCNSLDAPLQPSPEFRGYNDVSLGRATITADGTFVLRHLRFSGSAEAFDIGGHVTTEALNSSAARRLDYELTRDNEADSWTLTARLPSCGPGAPAWRVAVWCQRCTVGTGVVVDALAASTAPPPDGAEGQGPRTVVLVLRDAILPAGGGAAAAALRLASGAGDPRAARALLSATCLQGYAGCFTVDGIGSNFVLSWNLAAEPTDASSSILTMALSADPSGYVAVGFPRSPRQMVGASSMILQPCASCPTGASITEYYLANKLETPPAPGTQSSTPLGSTNLTASASASRMTGSFQAKLAGVAPASTSAFSMIYAAGQVSGGAPQYHDSRASNSLDLTAGLTVAAPSPSPTTGHGRGPSPSPSPSPKPRPSPPHHSPSALTAGGSGSSAKTAHMWLMAVGWGVFVPSGVVVARSFKPQGRWWYHAHRAVQSLGVTLGLVGLALGFVANGGWEARMSVHRDLGVAATALGLVQVASLVLHPAPGTQYRAAWGHYHAWVGRAAALLAISNIYYGILKVAELGAWAWAAYTAVLGAIVLVAVCKDSHDYLRRREEEKAGHGLPHGAYNTSHVSQGGASNPRSAMPPAASTENLLAAGGGGRKHWPGEAARPFRG